MREYFYTINARGQMFIDGSELADPGYRSFFTKHIRPNDTGTHPEYAWVSECAGEMNYLRAADTPVVFTELKEDELFYAPFLSLTFDPTLLRSDSEGTLYYPHETLGLCRVGPQPMRELSAKVRTWGPWYAVEHRGIVHVVEPIDTPDRLRLLRPKTNNICFGCGQDAEVGLALSFLHDSDNGSVQSWLTPPALMQGRQGWMHGGFVALLLDEIMGKALSANSMGGAPTAGLNVRFRSPVVIPGTIRLSARIASIDGRKRFVKGAIHRWESDVATTLLAESEGVFVKPRHTQSM